MTVPPGSPEHAEQVLGVWRLGKRLGQGGQGKVFHGTSVDGKREASIKIYDFDIDPKMQNRVRRKVVSEVEALRRVDLRSIVHVQDSGEHLQASPGSAGCIWVAFEYVKGQDLDYKMTKAPPNAAELATMLLTLAKGLDAIHSADIVHRDVKPANVVLRGHRWNDPVLVDFGLIRDLSAAKLSSTQRAVGTGPYIAPEVHRDFTQTGAFSDQWSFARLSAKLLMWIYDRELEDRTNGSRLIEEIADCFADSPAVAKVFVRALDENPNKRFSVVAAFVEALEKGLRSDGLIEQPDADKYGVEPWVGRRRLQLYLEDLGFSTEDKRPAGNLWVIASKKKFQSIKDYLAIQGVVFTFAPNGGRASQHKPAWFTKSDK